MSLEVPATSQHRIINSCSQWQVKETLCHHVARTRVECRFFDRNLLTPLNNLDELIGVVSFTEQQQEAEIMCGVNQSLSLFGIRARTKGEVSRMCSRVYG